MKCLRHPLKLVIGAPITPTMGSPTAAPTPARATTVPSDPAWTCVFNRRDFHALNVRADDDVLRLEHREAGRTVGALSGVLRDGVLTCGHSAPFGGLDLARPRETVDRVARLADHVLHAARDAGAARVSIRCRPDVYGPNEALVLFSLLNRGFRVQTADVSYVVDLAGFTSPEQYVAALKSPARRALKHLRGDRWSFRAASTDTDWRVGHELLVANRAAKGRRLALSHDYVRRARTALPEAIHMFLLDHDGCSCAAALVYVVAPGAWYVVAWGDAQHDLPRSPMNLLAFHTVAAALADGARLLDLGISSVPGTDVLSIDAGLAQFKTSILARPHTRLVVSA